MNLLAQHHRNGRRFRPVEFIEEGTRVAVKLAVTVPGWPVTVELYKVFTFRDPGDEVVLLQDCADEASARALLAQP